MSASVISLIAALCSQVPFDHAKQETACRQSLKRCYSLQMTYARELAEPMDKPAVELDRCLNHYLEAGAL